MRLHPVPGYLSAAPQTGDNIFKIVKCIFFSPSCCSYSFDSVTFFRCKCSCTCCRVAFSISSLANFQSDTFLTGFKSLRLRRGIITSIAAATSSTLGSSSNLTRISSASGKISKRQCWSFPPHRTASGRSTGFPSSSSPTAPYCPPYNVHRLNGRCCRQALQNNLYPVDYSPSGFKPQSRPSGS